MTLRGSEVRRGTGKATRASRGTYIRITISVSRFDSGDFGVIDFNVRLRGLKRVTLCLRGNTSLCANEQILGLAVINHNWLKGQYSVR